MLDLPWATAAASISPCGEYRYTLMRCWDPLLVRLQVVMLNPSTADALTDDRTIGRLVGFAQEWGYGGIDVCNLYAFRATQPADLWRTADPVGPDNDGVLSTMALFAVDQGTPVLAAWGVNAKRDRVREVVRIMRLAEFVTLGTTKDGHPRHPLYLPKSARPRRWEVLP